MGWVIYGLCLPHLAIPRIQCQPDYSSTKFEQFTQVITNTSNYKEATVACLHGLGSTHPIGLPAIKMDNPINDRDKLLFRYP